MPEFSACSLQSLCFKWINCGEHGAVSKQFR
jgi:hypothetical protein